MSEATLYMALGVTAWIAATVSPPVIAVVCWNLAKRLRPSWAVHVLFVPFLLLVEWFSIDALFFAAHDHGEGPPGLGFMVLPAFGLLLLSVVVYFCALLNKWIAGLRRRA